MNFYPDNFFYFITLFTICVFSGTYLLYTYYVNKLLLANTILLLLCASRVATEYYLQTLTSIEDVNSFLALQGYGIPINSLAALQWICVWFYVKPLSGWKHEKLANNIFMYGFVIIPFILHSWFMAKGDIFYYANQKIENYWRYGTNSDFWYYSIYDSHIKISLLIVISVLVVGVIRNKKSRLKQLFLLISYIIFPILFFKMNAVGKWNIPNSAILYISHSIIISWYVSNYRLFKSNIGLITKDLFNSISDLTISTNSSFKITNFNKKTDATFSMKFKNIYEFLENHLLNKEISSSNIIKDLLNNISKELVLKDKFGNEKIMSLKAAPFKNGNELYGYTFLFTDYTEIRKKEKALKELNLTKDRLFAIIGHDLRKPALEFRGIGQKINYLLKKQDFNKLQQLSFSIEQSALSLNNLLDNLLNWARQQRGAIFNDPKQIQVVNTIYNNFEFFEDIANNKSILLVNNVSNNTTILADNNAFSTIIRNLIDNAIKFTPSGGEITINETVNNKHVIISIQDTGVGIEPSQLQNIFTLNKNKTTKGTLGEAGSGIGLNLVKELVTINKGTITVNSILGKGSTFLVSFPK